MQLLPPVSEEYLLEFALNHEIQNGADAASRALKQFKKNNLVRFKNSGNPIEIILLQSLWVHHRLRATEINVGGIPFTIDVLNLCISGDVETAQFVVSQMVPDAMDQPYHFLSAEVLGELASLIGAEIGV